MGKPSPALISIVKHRFGGAFVHYVYVIVDPEGRTYTGFTSDLRRRVKEHNNGHTESTRGRQWKLVYYEAFYSEEDARQREQALKHNGNAKYWLNERIARSIQLED